ncbi:unnamed protein product, partial [Effrenium voratum]
RCLTVVPPATSPLRLAVEAALMLVRLAVAALRLVRLAVKATRLVRLAMEAATRLVRLAMEAATRRVTRPRVTRLAMEAEGDKAEGDEAGNGGGNEAGEAGNGGGNKAVVLGDQPPEKKKDLLEVSTLLRLWWGEKRRPQAVGDTELQQATIGGDEAANRLMSEFLLQQAPTNLNRIQVLEAGLARQK